MSFVRSLFGSTLLLLLQAQVALAQTQVEPSADRSAFLMQTVWFFIFAAGGYYFLVTRPEQLRQANQKQFMDSLKKNDEVITSGGIYGRIVAVRPDFVTLEIAPNVRIKVNTSNIQPPPKTTPEKESEAEKSGKGKVSNSGKE